jgi:hypothetical protein
MILNRSPYFKPKKVNQFAEKSYKGLLATVQIGTQQQSLVVHSLDRGGSKSSV